MKKSFHKILQGYRQFRDRYVDGDQSVMRYLADNGQEPEIMVLGCCDSRVDPAVILQCAPGDLFVIRNVANIVPPYNTQKLNTPVTKGTSAAMEFGIRFLKVKHFIILGHSQCGGIEALHSKREDTDFIMPWVSHISTDKSAETISVDDLTTLALQRSYENCLTFPWIKQKVENNELAIHLWFFCIRTGEIKRYNPHEQRYETLNVDEPYAL